MDRSFETVLHKSRDLTVRQMGSNCNPKEINIKVVRKRADKIGESGRVIRAEWTFTHKIFTNLMQLNGIKLFFTMLGVSDVPDDMKNLSCPHVDAGL